MNANRIVVGAAFSISAVVIGLLLIPQSRVAPPAPRSAEAAYRTSRELEVAETVYDGKLGPGWEDWGWGPHELSHGPARVVFGGYGGFVFHHREIGSRFGAVVFRYRAPAGWGDFLVVSLKGAATESDRFPRVVLDKRHVARLADGWFEAAVDFAELNPHNLPIDRLTIAANKPLPSDWVLLDKVVFTASGSAALSGSGKRDEDLAILCERPAQPINPLIYGIAHGVWTSGETAHRIGGNPLTRLNWDLGNVWNVGSDWFFENASAGDSNIWSWLEDGVSHGAPTALLVPTIGWVAKDTTSVGFPSAKFGKQRKHDPNRPEAGDGFRPDGTAILPGPQTETSVEATPEVIGRWIRMLREKDQVHGKRSALLYILDNEPSLWNHTHRDVHPEPVTYDELLDRTLRYGAAIRGADAEGLIAGPAEWGWTGYFFSAKDKQAGTFMRPDRRAHGDMPLVPWYLARLAEHEKRTGARLLDALDLHFYPAQDGVYGANAKTDAATSDLRIRSTRALWDPSYRDESWIGEPVSLIPRMKEWVASNYPGRKLVIGEWSFGAEEHISGALAIAEALGRFGEQGLDMAFYWGGPKENVPAYWAFRSYRNFDGHGGRFLDWSLSTRTAESMSLFASRDAEKSHVVAVVINLDPSVTKNARIDVASCGGVTAQRAFSFSAGSQALAETPVIKQGRNVVVSTPPYSITVLDLRLDKPAD